MKLFKLSIGIILATALLVPTAGAGTVMKVKQTKLDPNAKNATGTIYVDKTRLRMEFQSGDERSALIYYTNEEDPVLLLVNLSEWSYIELTEKSSQKVRGKVQAQMEAMDAQLQQMPKEQREQIKKQFADQIEQAEQIINPRQLDKYSFKKVESGVEVDQWKCDHYKVLYDGDLDQEVWVADWKQLGLSGKEFKIFGKMVGTFKSFAVGAGLFAAMSHKGVGGCPVQSVLYKNGAEQHRLKMTEITEQDLKPDLFELSKDYDKTEFGP